MATGFLFNNSLLVQFGRSGNISGTNTTITVTLPISFKTSISAVLLTNRNCGYYASIYEAGLALTNIQIRREANAGIGSHAAFFLVIGY